MDAIQINDLTKNYGKTRGIDHLNLTVAEGDFFGFIGPNGAGKSTTIRILLGLISPTSGRAEIFGRDVTKEKKVILQNVGYLPAEAVLYSGMKVKDVLKLSADLRNADCTAEAGKLCERLKLDTTRKVEELSFGNRKKVAIICALQHFPRLLVMDEPTGGLDPLMQREFFEILKERNHQGVTIFLSSHVLSEVQNNCTRAAIIREGSVLACDSVDNLAKTNAKRVSLKGQVNLTGLPGIRDVQEADGSMRFLYGGEIGRLLQVLAAGKVADLAISEPDLEEVFLQDYEKDGGRV